MKYKITEETVKYKDRLLHRIVREGGVFGGLIEQERNLSQKGKCWVEVDAKVYGNAKVRDNAMIYGEAEVYESASVRDSARVFGKARVYGYASIQHRARIYGDARVYGFSSVRDQGVVRGKSKVSGCASIEGCAMISGTSIVCDDANIRGWSKVLGCSIVKGYSLVKHEAIIENGILYSGGRVREGVLKGDMFEDMKNYIACSLGVYPIEHYYYLYKRVRKIHDGYYRSCYKRSFYYADGIIAEVNCPNPDRLISCSTGLHVSTAHYWTEGNTLIHVKVHEDDIITCLDGKIRCSKLEVIGEV